MVEIEITKHAYDRMKERYRFKKETVDKMALTAYENGIRHGDTTGGLSKYISGRVREYPYKGSRIVIYGEIVYIFIDVVKGQKARLITAFGIPNSLKSSALGKQKKKRG